VAGSTGGSGSFDSIASRSASVPGLVNVTDSAVSSSSTLKEIFR
jgi:hypothetical protein